MVALPLVDALGLPDASFETREDADAVGVAMTLANVADGGADSVALPLAEPVPS